MSRSLPTPVAALAAVFAADKPAAAARNEAGCPADTRVALRLCRAELLDQPLQAVAQPSC